MPRHSPHRPALRGLATRFFSLVLGAAVAGSLVVSMQLPLSHQAATSSVTLSALDPPAVSGTVAWPNVGSAALVIPSLHVSESWHNRVVPIASLTKMMTAYVTLQKFPLATGQNGPCVTVKTGDVSTYQTMLQTDQSNVAIAVGESLCEADLLKGLLVHSANNYASLLAVMVAGSVPAFVTLMNESARALGLDSTHYVDVSGFDAGSVSTALDQGELAAVVMRSPLVRSLVMLPSVTLPIAGTVNSYTPYVGSDNVIGVKSGRTLAAGGCDVMAMTFPRGASNGVLYAIVLGQRGGDLLGPAGTAALALADSALRLQHRVVLGRGSVVAHVGWGSQRTAVVLTASHTVSWWSAQGTLPVSVQLRRFTSTIHRGDEVGWLVVRGVSVQRFALSAQSTVSPPTLWQRLR